MNNYGVGLNVWPAANTGHKELLAFNKLGIVNLVHVSDHIGQVAYKVFIVFGLLNAFRKKL